MKNNNSEIVEKIARQLYDTYCEAVGGKAFNGDLLPKSDEFFADDSKQVQANAWRAAAATMPTLEAFDATMRAKMKVHSLKKHEHNPGSDAMDELIMGAVTTKDYDDNGLDEDNTFAKFTPSADLNICITNPALIGEFKVGDVFYVDFIRSESTK